MEGQKKRRPPVLLLMILVLFLTVGGLALAVQSFGRYDTLLLEQSDSQLSVSYTHLDVYKRQMPSSSPSFR